MARDTYPTGKVFSGRPLGMINIRSDHFRILEYDAA